MQYKVAPVDAMTIAAHEARRDAAMAKALVAAQGIEIAKRECELMDIERRNQHRIASDAQEQVSKIYKKYGLTPGEHKIVTGLDGGTHAAGTVLDKENKPIAEITISAPS
jgi:hypothetical protein